MFPQTSLFQGKVVHQRVSPVRHKLKYSVFSLLIDLNEIEGFGSRHRLFSHNKWNLLSLYDRDYADGKQDDLVQYAQDQLAQKLPELKFEKVMLLTYPRVLGHVFNPLSIYIFLDVARQPVAAIFEVSNTFSGRTNYICKIENGLVDQAQKSMLVSPFNSTKGLYSFRLKHDEEEISIGVALRENGVPLLNTWYKCNKVKTSDWQIIKLLLKMPIMTLKVVLGIHYEALKLWFKGLRPPKRTSSTKKH